MPNSDALANAVSAAFNAIASTVGLPWEVKKRVLKRMERILRTYAYASADDFAAWAEEEMADLLDHEDIRPLCRLALASWFAQEVLNWLTGNFDNAAD